MLVVDLRLRGDAGGVFLSTASLSVLFNDYNCFFYVRWRLLKGNCSQVTIELQSSLCLIFVMLVGEKGRMLLSKKTSFFNTTDLNLGNIIY